ncbi:branched-chain amino acid aminotransferase [Bacillus sp. FJAT-29937]|uniref:branched-chain amino acid aminotransferase n=1 Tax=Bacillus sp. FJAT-29937 TaxID=1720553 RepID=UPI00083482AE|nr:branched-chain amino acid aminotransferase [Bacillus sp. FJAT-29937]
MLKSKFNAFLLQELPNVELFKEEIDYAKKQQLISEEMIISEKNDDFLFSDAYIERSNKETEELLAEESEEFLHTPIHYLEKHKQEFIYIETSRLNIVSTDSLCLEVDDVFGTYEVMLGLKLQKKHEKAIKSFLMNELKGDPKFSLLFSQADGLWDFNFALNGVEGFTEEMTIGEASKLVYLFLFKLLETVEENNQ